MISFVNGKTEISRNLPEPAGGLAFAPPRRPIFLISFLCGPHDHATRHPFAAHGFL